MEPKHFTTLPVVGLTLAFNCAVVHATPYYWDTTTTSTLSTGGKTKSYES